MTEAKIDVIPRLKKVLQRQYENGYDSACDAIEEAIAELDRLRAALRDFDHAAYGRGTEDLRERHAEALRDAGEA
jgi:hypothetical protein